MPRFKVNPGRPSGISPPIDSFVLASVCVKTLATCFFKRLRGYIKLQGVRSPLRPACFPVYASDASFGYPGWFLLPDAFVTSATLGKGGWLVLTLQGLSPCQYALNFLAR